MHGIARFLAWAKGILVRVNENGVGRCVHSRQLSEGRFVIELKRGAGGDHGGDFAEVAARKAALQEFFLVLVCSARHLKVLLPGQINF